MKPLRTSIRGLSAIADTSKERIRDRPLAAVGSATVIGFVIGSLSPRMIARPAGALALKFVLSRLIGTREA